MELIDMANPEPPKEEAPSRGPFYEKYPYGLVITLNGQSLEKLGKKAGDFNINMTGEIEGAFKVIAVRDIQKEKIGGNAISDIDTAGEQSVELQLTGISLESKEMKPKGIYQKAREGWKAGPGE
jgi:hypothetical protein